MKKNIKYTGILALTTYIINNLQTNTRRVSNTRLKNNNKDKYNEKIDKKDRSRIDPIKKQFLFFPDYSQAPSSGDSASGSYTYNPPIIPEWLTGAIPEVPCSAFKIKYEISSQGTVLEESKEDDFVLGLWAVSPTSLQEKYNLAFLDEFNLLSILANRINYNNDVYSNYDVVFTMTNNGISFSASVNIDAGGEIDTGDFELDGVDVGTAGLGAVSMTGSFGTLTFDDTAFDVSSESANNSTWDVDLGYSVGGVALTYGVDESDAWNQTAVIALGDASTFAVAAANGGISSATTLNGVSVSVESANNSTWDVDLGYTAAGFALTYGVDETDAWTATATSALGGGATFAAAGSEDNVYAGVSFAF